MEHKETYLKVSSEHLDILDEATNLVAQFIYEKVGILWSPEDVIRRKANGSKESEDMLELYKVFLPSAIQIVQKKVKA